jgi:multiple sugar transport system permease protein
MLALLAPALIVLTAVTIGPVLHLFGTSFTPFDLARPDSVRFIGAANYQDAINDARFWNSVYVQAKLSTFTVGGQLLFGLGLALLLNRRLPFREFIRTGFLIPMVLPPIIVAITWKILFTPLLTPMNLVTLPLGIVQPAWLTDPGLALWTIIIANIWEWVPFTTLLLLAGLQMIPEEPLEAAKIDGASAWQAFLFVTLPLLAPTIVVAGLFRLIDSFKAFPLIYVMTNGGPGTVTEATNYYAYIEAFSNGQIGYPSAIIVVLLIFTLVLTAMVIRLPRGSSDTE